MQASHSCCSFEEPDIQKIQAERQTKIILKKGQVEGGKEDQFKNLSVRTERKEMKGRKRKERKGKRGKKERSKKRRRRSVGLPGHFSLFPSLQYFFGFPPLFSRSGFFFVFSVPAFCSFSFSSLFLFFFFLFFASLFLFFFVFFLLLFCLLWPATSPLRTVSFTSLSFYLPAPRPLTPACGNTDKEKEAAKQCITSWGVNNANINNKKSQTLVREKKEAEVEMGD